MPKISQFKKFFEQSGLPYSVFPCDSLLKLHYDADHIDSVLRISGTDFCFDMNDDLIFSKKNHAPTSEKEYEKFKLASEIVIEKKIGESRPIISSECEYIDDRDLPILVLGTKIWYPFVDVSKWRSIRHQCAGLACDQFEIVGMVLHPTMNARQAMNTISDRWLGSNCGAFGGSVDDICEYRELLVETLGVDCNTSYDDFKEALYPIDANIENIRQLVTDNLPEELDQLIEWEDDFHKVCGIMSRWNLYIMGPNSD